jgi:hypothetical protein
MNAQDRKTRFLDHARSVLDREAARLDTDTTTRLRKIRYQALAKSPSSPAQFWQLIRIPTAAVATGLLLTAVIVMQFRSPATFQAGDTLADLEILASSEQLDLFSDLDFYYWLAETEDHAG